jgi:hypothetical protein
VSGSLRRWHQQGPWAAPRDYQPTLPTLSALYRCRGETITYTQMGMSLNQHQSQHQHRFNCFAALGVATGKGQQGEAPSSLSTTSTQNYVPASVLHCLVSARSNRRITLSLPDKLSSQVSSIDKTAGSLLFVPNVLRRLNVSTVEPLWYIYNFILACFWLAINPCTRITYLSGFYTQCAISLKSVLTMFLQWVERVAVTSIVIVPCQHTR